MDYYDVVIVGCGPAGGQCARELSHEGVKLLLVEKGKSFSANNYSSGGVPLSVMEEYQIPESVVGSYWNTLSVHSSYRKKLWQQSSPFGAILDFKKLREFLSDEAVKNKGVLALDTLYLDHWEQGECLIVKLVNHTTRTEYTVRTKVLVDATGSERSVLMKNHCDPKKGCHMTGIEYLVRVPETIFASYANKMSLFFGHRWMPQGYAWVFPMDENLLKIGIIRYYSHDQFVPYNKSYKHYLDHLIETIVGTKEPEILDKHGKTIYYSHHRNDRHYEDRVIALGDAVSTVNPLACEGIRHALKSGKVAAPHILKKLKDPNYSFSSYRRDLKKVCGYRWSLSEWIMNTVYKIQKDAYYDLIIEAFDRLSAFEIMDFAFQYRLSTALKFCSYYYPKRLKLLFLKEEK